MSGLRVGWQNRGFACIYIYIYIYIYMILPAILHYRAHMHEQLHLFLFMSPWVMNQMWSTHTDPYKGGEQGGQFYACLESNWRRQMASRA